MNKENLQTSPDERVRDAGLSIKEGFNALVEELQQGHTERFLDYLRFTSRFHKYSPNNQFLIWMQKPEATYVAGYNKWKEMGYQVKRDEHGINILAPVIVKVQLEETNTSPGEIVNRLIGYKLVKVFDASQLTETPKEGDLFRGLPDDAKEQSQVVWKTVTQQGIVVYEKRLGKGTFGQAGYRKLDDHAALCPTIEVSPGLHSRVKTAVLIHEWAHHLIHFDGLSGLISAAAKAIPIGVKEAQVEACAYIVCKHLGVEPPMSSDYILLYRNNADTLIDNLAVIQSTSHKMIQELERVVKEADDARS